MKRLFANIMMLLLLAVVSLPQAATAVMEGAKPHENPCPMHAAMLEVVVDSAASPPCDGCDAIQSACQGSHCSCCYPSALVMSTGAVMRLRDNAPPLQFLLDYVSVKLSLEVPPPRSLPL